MSIVRFATVAALTLGFLAASGGAQEQYPDHPDSVRKPNVPTGSIEGPFVFDQSKIFPGTTRQYWLYVPQQYDAQKTRLLDDRAGWPESSKGLATADRDGQPNTSKRDASDDWHLRHTRPDSSSRRELPSSL